MQIEVIPENVQYILPADAPKEFGAYVRLHRQAVREMEQRMNMLSPMQRTHSQIKMSLVQEGLQLLMHGEITPTYETEKK